MKIGKATVPRSALTISDAETITVRGKDLSRDLIGQVNFSDYFYFLLTGKTADAATGAVLNAALVAIAEHGLVPSVQAARMTLAAAPEALQGAVAAGILGCGSVILGASETAGRMFVEIDEAAKKNGGELRGAARSVVAARRERKLPIPGYGHPEHKARDRRVDALFEVSRSVGGGQRFIEIAKVVEELIPAIVGKDLRLNVSAAIPAVLLGVGFPVGALKGIPILARTASLIAHLNEEMSEPIGFALSHQATREFEYTGVEAKK